jgi:S-DNA-T family DNA segregation ATPase FtsK/SpoIIIE
MSVNKPRGNTQRQKPEEAAAPRFRVSLDWEHIFTSPKNTLAWGTFFIILGVILETSFFSYIVTGLSDQSVLDGLAHQSLRDAGRQTRNFLGVLGAVVSHIFVYRWFGVGALLLPLVPFVAGWKMAFGREILPLSRTTREVIFFTLWVSVLMGYVILMSNTENTLSFLSGGFGYLINISLFDWLKWGSVLPILFALFVFAVFFYDVRDRYESWQARHAKPEVADDTGDPLSPGEPGGVAAPGNAFVSVVNDTYDDEVLASEEEPDSDLETEEEAPRPAPHPAVVLSVTPSVSAASTAVELPVMPMEVSAVPSEPLLELEVEDTTPAEEEFEDEDVNASILREFGQYDPMLDLPSYHFPHIDLLNEVTESQHEKVSQEELESNKTKIVDTLGSYGINISKIKATIGPTVTLYEIIPEAGVRISKIKNLEGDIALSLAALGIRIIAPMPGRGTIGIEVPNKNRETVFARSVLANERFQKSNYDLPIVLGKTISNDIHIADLAKMPHLLMAGATGQGKSVGLNVILASLIYKKHPAELKFVLVDPKKVELTLFNKLERHFLAKLPNAEEAIITDTKKVIFTLNSLCIEMDSRYDLLKEAAVRNLKEYNAKFAATKAEP